MSELNLSGLLCRRRGCSHVVGLVQRGFTLIELMVTIVVIGVLLGIVVPSFTDMTLTSKLRTQVMELQAGALLARSEAIKRNQPVRFCASNDGETCSGDWVDGWVVLAQDDSIIQVGTAAANGFLIESEVAEFEFSATGAGTTASSLRVCRFNPSVGARERVLTVGLTGRTNVETTEDGVCEP